MAVGFLQRVVPLPRRSAFLVMIRRVRAALNFVAKNVNLADKHAMVAPKKGKFVTDLVPVEAA